MRILASLLLVSTVVLGVNALATGDDAKPTTTKRLESLELKVDYLLTREAALSAYVLRNAQRADALDALVTKVTNEGFTKRAIPTSSRESLLAGLKAMAEDLRTDLPERTEEELLALKKLEAQKAK